MGEKGPGPHHMRIHKLYEIFSGIIHLLPVARGWAMKGLLRGIKAWVAHRNADVSYLHNAMMINLHI